MPHLQPALYDHSSKPLANRIPGPNLRRLHVGLDVEGEPFWLAASGIIWFTVAIAGSCAVIALLAGYIKESRSSEKVTQALER